MSYPKLSKGNQSRLRYENRIERVVTGRELQIHSRYRDFEGIRLRDYIST